MVLGNLWLRRSASMLACSVRSISIRPSLVHKPYCPVRPFVSYSTAANDDDEWISSEKAVIREIDAEFNARPIEVNENNMLGCFIRSFCKWNDRSRGCYTLPDDFPFKVEDIPGTRTVTFTREYKGEHIKVVLSMTDDEDESDDDDDPSNYEDDETNDDDAPSNDEDDETNDDDAPSNELDDDYESEVGHVPSISFEVGRVPSISFVCSVTKQSGRGLELHCNLLSSDQISIDDIHVNLPGDSSEDPKVIRDMDAVVGLMYDHTDLKEAFNKYLKVRGVDTSTIYSMRKYMLDKMKVEYWLWLESVKEVLEE